MESLYNEYGVIPENSPFLDEINQIDTQIGQLFDRAVAEGYDIAHIAHEMTNVTNSHYCLRRMKQGIAVRKQNRAARVDK
jgi:uncharacterized protein (UPF0335 family)